MAVRVSRQGSEFLVNTEKSEAQIDPEITRLGSGGFCASRNGADGAAAGPSAFVFIDARVSDIDTLLGGIFPGAEVRLLDPARDGLSQIAELLRAARATGLAAISIVAHGAPGRLEIGPDGLDAAGLSAQAASLPVLAAALSDEGVLRLYACETGRDACGREFVAALSMALGGRAVAAATRPIGDGRVWDLDVAAGETLRVPSWPPLTREAQLSYQASLANTAPDGTDNTVTTDEDTPYTFTAADFGFTDNDGNTLQAVKITTLPTTGGLRNNGVAVGTGQLVSVADITGGKLVYTPIANTSGSAYGSFTFQVQDNGGIASGGVDLDQSPNTITVNVNAVNDAPTFAIGDGVLTTGAVSRFFSVAVQPDGRILAGGQYFYYNNDYYYDFGIARFNGDGTPDTNFGVGGVVTTNIGPGREGGNSVAVQADGKILFGGYSYNGTIYDSTAAADFAIVRYNPNGTLDTSFGGTGKVTTPIKAGEDRGNSVALQSDGKILLGGTTYNGSNNDFVIVRYNTNGTLDTTFGSGGRVTTAVGAGDDVGASVVVQSDGKILLGGTSAGATSDDFAIVRYNTNGTLDSTFGTSGKAVTDFLSRADGGAGVALQTDGKILLTGTTNSNGNKLGLVRYNANGTLDTTFGSGGKVTTALVGSGNTYGTGVVTQPDGKILVGGYATFENGFPDFAVVRYNADGSLDTSFGTGGMVSTPIGQFDDYAYSIALQPDGRILLAGYGASAGSAIARYNVDGTLDLTFDPVNTLNGTPTFTENGTAVVLDGDVQVFDAEQRAAGSYAGATLTLARSGGASSDDRFAATGTLSALTQGGALVVGGVTVGTVTTNAAGTLVLTFSGANATEARVNAVMQQITYANASEAPPATADIAWTFSDGNSGAQGSGGVKTVTGHSVVTILSVNDAPAGTNKTVTTLEDTGYTFATSDFGFSDTDGNTLQGVKITALPTAGTLRNNGATVTAGQVIAATDITGGKLVYTPAANGSGSPYRSFTFQVQDNGGTANGGLDLDQSPNTITVNVTGVNDAPAGTNKTVTTLEDTAYTFTTGDFGFTDPNDSPANTLLSVTIATLPTAGTLRNNGAAVAAGQVIAVADITGGKLVYTPNANANGAAYGSFTFQVQDNGGTLNGGIDLDQSPNTITVNVTSVNDAPAGTDKTITTLEDTAYTLTTADFGFTDPNDTPANTFQSVIISSRPTSGTLRNNGTTVASGAVISVADITAGRLVFTPVANASFTSYMAFQVQDNGTTTNGGQNTDQSWNYITFNTTPVNDAPVGTSKTVTTLEDTAYTFSTADFGFSGHRGQ